MQNLTDLSNSLKRLQKQIPFATANALTKTVREIEIAQKQALPRRLDRPTSFTVNSVGSIGARKDNLLAKVFVKDIAAEYLEPFEIGGQHKLNSKAILAPVNVSLNKFGNLTRNKMKQLTAKSDTFVGELKGVSGVWQRVKPRKIKKKGKVKRSQKGMRAERPKQPHPKLLISFQDPLEVEPTLDYHKRAASIVNARMHSNLEESIRHALRTAR